MTKMSEARDNMSMRLSKDSHDESVPDSLSPMEQAMWTLRMFARQVATFVEDAEMSLTTIVSQEFGEIEDDVWSTIARAPRRLRPRGQHRMA